MVCRTKPFASEAKDWDYSFLGIVVDRMGRKTDKRTQRETVPLHKGLSAVRLLHSSCYLSGTTLYSSVFRVHPGPAILRAFDSQAPGKKNKFWKSIFLLFYHASSIPSCG